MKHVDLVTELMPRYNKTQVLKYLKQISHVLIDQDKVMHSMSQYVPLLHHLHLICFCFDCIYGKFMENINLYKCMINKS